MQVVDALVSASRFVRRHDGAVVSATVDGGPAAEAGLREGDLIVEINRSPTRDLEAFNDQVRNMKKGETYLFRIIRQNRGFYVGFRL